MTPKFYKCKACGQIVAAVEKKACPVKCCGEAMEEITANTVDAAKEKHVWSTGDQKIGRQENE